jgi:hypothetical protein
METPLIGSGSQEEVDRRVKELIDLGKANGYITFEELNERLPDEVVSPEKLDALLMNIDEMGIRLIDEADVPDFHKGGKPRVEPSPRAHAVAPCRPSMVTAVAEKKGRSTWISKRNSPDLQQTDRPGPQYLTQMDPLST